MSFDLADKGHTFPDSHSYKKQLEGRVAYMTQVGKDLCVTTCTVGTGNLTLTVTYSRVSPYHVSGMAVCVMVSHFPGVEADMGMDFILCTEHYERSVVFLS